MDELIASAEPAPDGGSPALSFFVDEDSGQLQVLFDPTQAAAGVDRRGFDASVRAAGYAHYYLDLDAIDFFLAETKVVKTALHAVVGARRDAQCWITLSDDLMTASLTLLPARGGKPIGTHVHDALREKGIMHGVLHDVIDAALASGFCEDVVIARGSPAREGVPAQFESMLLDKQKQLEQLEENAVIKYRDLGHLLLVSPGNRLMRRTPPVQGTNGIDVLGQTVFPPPLPQLEFGAGFSGAVPDPANPDMLLAAIAGQPVVLENGVIINPVVNVENVDLGTGNITFDGTIHVSGDVKTGMTVRVTGDIIIGGTLEAAELHATGNVAVAGGILGRADPRPGATVLPPDTARIIAGGSVQALFVENAHIEAGDSILIERSARQCELIALNEVVVGSKGSKVSQIIGGLTQAKKRIQVAVLGSNAGVKTRVQVGYDPYANSKLAEANKTLAQKGEELQRVLQLLVFFRQNPKKGEGGVLQKVNGSREKLVNEIHALTTTIGELKENLGMDEQARIQVDRALYFGSEVRIGNQVWQVLDDVGGTIIGLVDGKIATGLSPQKAEAPVKSPSITLTKKSQNIG